MLDTLPCHGYSRMFAQLAFADIGLGPVLLLAFVVLAIVAVTLFAWRPDLVLRGILWLPAHLVYRLRIQGRATVPPQGPVLFLCNHLSFFDALLVFLAQRRSIRFLLWTKSGTLSRMPRVCRWLGIIPLDSSAGPRSILGSLRAAGEALARGEAVCIFSEGGITPGGELLPFQRGLEQIVHRGPAPIVPVHVGHAWGSMFSARGGRAFRKWPRRLPYPANVAFGKPLASNATIFEIRQAIQKLAADCAIARRNEITPVHREFVRRACKHPLRPCIIDTLNRGKVYRYGEVLAGAWIMARLLKPIVRDDHMVGIWLPPSAGAAFANIAVALLGKVVVNLNYSLSAQVNASAVRQCELRRVLTSRQFVDKMPFPVPGVEVVFLEDFRKQVTTPQRLRAFFTILILPRFVIDRWVLRLGRHRGDDLATVVFSSGSTGDPKGVMLSHRNLAANSESIIQAIDPRPHDRLLGILPFFHSFGYTVTLWVPLQVGASLVFHPDPRQAKEIGELSRIYRCTILVTTPTFLRYKFKRCQPGEFSTLRLLIVGAEKLPVSLIEEFHDKFGVVPLEGYGCTELAPVAAVNLMDWDENGRRLIGNRPGTIGQPLPGVCPRIVHPESFETMPANQEGLLLFYGANVMEGYLGLPELTRQVIRDGWYITGDMARIDHEGFITITGRLSRFSKIGGEMVPHQKIEEELHAILGTNERICVVTAVPDERRGERIVVLHTPLNGLNQHHLAEQLGDKGLPNLWIPSERDFFEVLELPILGSGKLDLKRVQELALEKARS